MRRHLQIIAAAGALVLCAMGFHAWLASHDEQLRLQAVLKTQSQLIDAANQREHDRAITLDQTVAEIAKLKRETQTPQQVLRELPKYLPLPQPITMAQNGDERSAASGEMLAQTGLQNSLSQTRTDAGVEAPKKGRRASPKTGASRVLDSLAGDVESVRRELGLDLSTRVHDSTIIRSRRFASRGVRSNIFRRILGRAPPTCDRGQSNNPRVGVELSLPDAPRPSTPFSPSLGRSAQIIGSGPEITSGRDAGATGTGSERNDSPSSKNPTTEQPNFKQSVCVDNPGPSTSGTNPAVARIPAADLKPLYDYVQDCRACQAQLAAAKQDHVDDEAKLAAMTRERDAAITAKKGGSFWRRLRSNAAWFAVGAATATAAGTAIAIGATHPARATPKNAA
jgi:hypothetical protein